MLAVQVDFLNFHIMVSPFDSLSTVVLRTMNPAQSREPIDHGHQLEFVCEVLRQPTTNGEVLAFHHFQNWLRAMKALLTATLQVT